METTNFSSLPQEVQLGIFAFLTPEEQCLNTTVSKTFNLLLNDDLLWKPTAREWGAIFDENQSVKEGCKNRVEEIKRMNQIFRGLFLEVHQAWILAHGGKQPGNMDELQAYKDYINNKTYKSKIHKVLDQEIKKENLSNVKAICSQGFTPNLFTLNAAVHTKNLEIIEFFMDNWKEKFEKELKKKEPKPHSEHLDKVIYIQHARALIGAEKLIQEKKRLEFEKEMAEFISSSPLETPPSDTDDHKKVKNRGKSKSEEIKEMNQAFRKMFPVIQQTWVSEHGNKHRKDKAEFRAYQDYLKDKSNRTTIQKAIGKEIKKENLNHVKAICNQGFTPNLFTLNVAVHTKNLGIVEFFMDNWKEKFEKELKKKELKSHGDNLLEVVYGQHRRTLGKAKKLIQEKENLDAIPSSSDTPPSTSAKPKKNKKNIFTKFFSKGK